LAKSLGSALGAAVAIGITAAGVQAHADGGVFSTPHVGLVAEAGPEAIIPLNNPGRAAEVMAEAGLGGMMSPTVNVYIGNQQIDAYIDSRVNQSMAVTARSLTYGSRGI
jgi:phage-related minor tail protein